MAGPHRRRTVLQGVATAVAVGSAGCASVVTSSNGTSIRSGETTENDPAQLCALAVVNDDDARHEVRVRVERDGRTILDRSATVSGGRRNQPVTDELPVQATRIRGRVGGTPWRVFGLASRGRDELGVSCTVQDHRDIAFSVTDECG